MQHTGSTVTEICVVSNPGYLPRVRKIVSCLADCAGMDGKEVNDAELAIIEACTNAIRHGSPGGALDRVTVRLFTDRDAVVAEVRDEGNGFDRDLVKPHAVIQPGGLGISLMETLTDEVEYLRERTGMTVRLVKRAKRLSGHGLSSR